MNSLNLTNFKFKNIMFFLFGLYTILPSYFTIFGYSSSFVFAIFLILVFIFYSIISKLTIYKEAFFYSIILCILMEITFLINKQWNVALKTIIEYLCLFLIASSMIKTKDDIILLFKKIVFFAIIECIFSYIHFFADFNIFSLLQNESLSEYALDSSTQYRMNMVRVEGSFGHAITFGIYISICACICMFIYQNDRSKKRYLVYYFMCFVSLIMTLSRMPIIVFIFSQIIYLFSLNFTKIIKILLSILAISVLIYSVGVLFFNSFIESVFSIFELVLDVFSDEGLSGLTSYNTDSAFSYRAEMLSVLPNIIRQNPFFGIGDSYNSSSFYFIINGWKQTSIDNQYFLITVTNGYIGLIGFLWEIFGVFLFFRLNKEKCPKYMSIGFLKFVIVFIYAINLFSVAQMFEYKLMILLYSVFFADIHLRRSNAVEQNTINLQLYEI